jgi:hypothetical protein
VAGGDGGAGTQAQGLLRDLFPACPCGDVAENDGLCDRCSVEQVYRQDHERRQSDLVLTGRVAS